MGWLLLAIFVIVGGISLGVYLLYRHEVAHPAIILRQAAARNMEVVAAARKPGTSRWRGPGTVYELRLRALNGTKTVAATCAVGRLADTFAWDEWHETTG